MMCNWDSLQSLNTAALSNSLALQVIKVDHEAHGVDTPGDIAKVEAVMRAHHMD